jgi:hypothetical protein
MWQVPQMLECCACADWQVWSILGHASPAAGYGLHLCSHAGDRSNLWLRGDVILLCGQPAEEGDGGEESAMKSLETLCMLGQCG